MKFEINVPMTFKVLTAVTLLCSLIMQSIIRYMEAAGFSEMSIYCYRLHDTTYQKTEIIINKPVAAALIHRQCHIATVTW